LADSAFPTGGFAHSAGLEAAWQHGEIRTAANCASGWSPASTKSRHGAAVVNAAYAEPKRLTELDQLFDAFTSNHVANRASRLQGKALLGRLSESSMFHGTRPFPIHARALRPVFGAVVRALGLTHSHAIRLFVFMHLRSVMRRRYA